MGAAHLGDGDEGLLAVPLAPVLALLRLEHCVAEAAGDGEDAEEAPLLHRRAAPLDARALAWARHLERKIN